MNIGGVAKFSSFTFVLANVGAIATVLAAVAQAWRSADRVVPENRVWTRAWRLGIILAATTLFGVIVPLGAIYTLAKYRRPSHVSTAS